MTTPTPVDTRPTAPGPGAHPRARGDRGARRSRRGGGELRGPVARRDDAGGGGGAVGRDACGADRAPARGLRRPGASRRRPAGGAAGPGHRGAALTGATAVAARSAGVSRTLTAVSAVFCPGLALPLVSWAVTYLLPLWFAGVGIWLWRRA